MSLKKCTALLLAAFLLVGSVSAQEQERESVRIAVIDSGISTAAIAADRLAEGYNYISTSGSTEDTTGHGTAVASIIVGCESAGIPGLCPEAVLIPLVYMGLSETGESVPGDLDRMAQMIRDAVDIYHCDIINISYSALRRKPALKEAVTYAREKGVLVVSVSGNGADTNKYFPGAYEDTLCVGAVDTEGNGKADFSTANEFVDLIAPGVNVPVAQMDGTYTEKNGTSFSAAYISGAAAKLMTEYPDLTALQVEQILLASSCDLAAPGRDHETGWGVLDVENALLYAETGRLFRDVASGDWFFNEVNEAAERGILNGTDAVSFSPNQPTTRAMLWVMLYRSEGLAPSESPKSWYSDAQAWMISNDISDGSDPNSAITREQMATILWRYAMYKGINVSAKDESVLSGFGDAAYVSDWAVDAMKWACGAGLINGSGGALLPGSAADRAQTAVILMRFLKM